MPNNVAVVRADGDDRAGSKAAMSKKLRRVLDKGDPTPEERKHFADIMHAFASNVVTKNAFDEVWESPDNLESFVLAHDTLKPHMAFLLRAQHNKDVYVPSPALDLLLTVLFIAEWAWMTFIMMHQKPLASFPDVPLWIVFVAILVAVAIAVALTKKLSVAVGRALASCSMRNNMCTGKPLTGPIQMKKWTDQSWQFVVHVSMTVFGIWLFNTSEEGLWQNTAKAWDPHPEVFEPQDRLVLFYLTQLAIWTYTCLIHRFFMERIKDYFMMYFHHIVTIALVAGSLQYNFLKIGLLVVFIHDATDIFVDTLKLTNYLKVMDRKGYFIVEIAFFANLVSWAVLRHYVFPVRIIKASLLDGYSMMVEGNPLNYYDEWLPVRAAYYARDYALSLDPRWPMACPLNYLLIALEILHIMWFHLFLKILWRILFESSASAGAKEYEGDSDGEDEEDDDAHPKRD